MASRLHRPRRLARPACAALGVVACLAAGGARAQQAAFGDLDLRGEETAQSDEAGPLAAPPAVPPPSPSSESGAAAGERPAGRATPAESETQGEQERPAGPPALQGRPAARSAGRSEQARRRRNAVAERGRPADSVQAEASAPRRQAVRSHRNRGRRPEADALRRGGPRMVVQSRPSAGASERLGLPHLRSGPRTRFGLVDQRGSRQFHRRPHQLFHRSVRRRAVRQRGRWTGAGTRRAI